MITQQPLVSVLMTTYNREKYIVAAVESVLASSYKNFELILVDDGSKDKTVEIARQLAQKDARIKVFINEKNLGDYPNRNKAASYASGKYLKYVDADDYIYPLGLEVLVTMMEANPVADWGLCSFEQVVPQPFPLLLLPNQIFEHEYFGSGLFHRAPLSSIIKKEIFEEVGGFKPYRMVGDNEMWQRLALDYPVLLMPDGVVWYREHDEQEINNVKKYMKMYCIIQIHYITHPKCLLSKQQINYIVKQARKRIMIQFFKLIVKTKLKDACLQWKLLMTYYSIKHKPLPVKID